MFIIKNMKIFYIKLKNLIKKFVKTMFYLNPYLYFFYFKNLLLPSRIRKVVFKLFPIIDPFIIFRKPKLKFLKRKLEINDIYLQEDEYREDSSPYIAFYNILNKTFDLNLISSIIDIGCSTGHLINNIKKNYPHINVKGIEYFEFHKSTAPIEIRNDIFLKDIREMFDVGKFDIVICTEVAEHIEPNYLVEFLSNLKNASNKYLVMTWSNSYPHFNAPPQHVSSINYNDYLKILENFDYIQNSELTKTFINESMQENKFNYWWRDSLVVFENKITLN